MDFVRRRNFLSIYLRGAVRVGNWILRRKIGFCLNTCCLIIFCRKFKIFIVIEIRRDYL